MKLLKVQFLDSKTNAIVWESISDVEELMLFKLQKEIQKELDDELLRRMMEAAYNANSNGKIKNWIE